MTLYDSALDENCYRVRLLLSLLRLPYTVVPVDIFPGQDHLTLPLIALNPGGDLPILVDGGVTITGTTAIMMHLARRHGGDLLIATADLALSSQVAAWLEFSALQLGAARQSRMIAVFGAPGDAAGLRIASRKALRLMEDHLTRRRFEGGQWFVGNAPTLADPVLFPAFALSRDYGLGHEEFPALRRWARAMRALPGFQTMPGIPDYG